MKNRNLLVRLVAIPLLVATLMENLPLLALADSGDRFSIGRGSGESTDTLRVDSSGYVVVGADSLDTLTCKGPVTLESTLSVTGATSLAGLSCTTLAPSGAVVFSGNVTLGDATTDVVTFVSTSAVVPAAGIVRISTSSNQSGTNILAIDGTNKRVGIGSASPAKTLDVAGEITTNNTMTAARASLTYGLDASTMALTGAGHVAGQFTWGAAGTLSTATTGGNLTMPGNLTSADVTSTDDVIVGDDMTMATSGAQFTVGTGASISTMTPTTLTLAGSLTAVGAAAAASVSVSSAATSVGAAVLKAAYSTTELAALSGKVGDIVVNQTLFALCTSTAPLATPAVDSWVLMRSTSTTADFVACD